MYPDPTPFFIDFKMQKKYLYIYIFFFITSPQAHHIQSEKIIFLLKFCIKILFCRRYFSPLNTFLRIGKDTEPPQKHADPDPHYC